MKNIEWQVCSIEQAKKLEELGEKQESVFYWGNKLEKPNELYRIVYRYDGFIGHITNIEDRYSAFTAVEFGIMLNSVKADRFWITFGHFDCHCQVIKLSGERITVDGKTEAEAKANMVIELIKQGVLTVDRINHGLKGANHE